MFQTVYSSILYREKFAGPIVFLRLLLSLSQRGLLFTGRRIPSGNGHAIGPGVKESNLSQLK